MERRQVRYQGRVQGVGFRATAQWIAKRYPVTGWVRNEMDGDVLLEVQGEASAVLSFLKAVRERLGEYIAREDAATGVVDPAEAGFEIRR
jgi:acylphosphatase